MSHTEARDHDDAEPVERQDFGALLQRYRRAVRLSQEQLAARASLSTQAISALERGVRRNPHRDTVRLLAGALGLSGADHAALEATVMRGRTPLVAPAASDRTDSDPPFRDVPLPPTTLVGRAREVAEVAALVRDPAVRLLTLTGPGGVGKTRLALQVAREMLPHLEGGTVFVELAPLRGPHLVAAAIARAVGLRESADRPLAEGLRAHFGDTDLLLVLDNFEHVGAAAPLVADLLAGCPRLRVLATSRATLHVRGERIYPVHPLPTPDPARLPALDTLATIPSVDLLVRRARDVAPDFALDATTASDVAALCVRLDGLPLALELAAARLTVLSPGLLARRLEQRLPLLTGGARDLPARQQTLRATVAWSYELLSAAEQALFRRLAVFAGGCTLEAVEAVCAGKEDRAVDVVDGIGALVDKSLLWRASGAEAGRDGEPRFAMLETLREYGLERLAEHGEAEATQALHAAHYCALAEATEGDLAGPGQAAGLARLEREYHNLRAALGWARASGNSETGLRVAGALWRFWYIRGNRSEGRDWLRALLDPPTGAHQAVAPPVRAKALRGAGVLATERGDFAHAVACCTEGLALYRASGDASGSAAVLIVLGSVAKQQGDYDRAAALFAESLALWRAAGDRRMEAVALNNLGSVALDQADYGRAAALLEESLTIKRGLGDTHRMAASLLNLGDTVRCLGDYARATTLLEEALAAARALADKEYIALSLSNLAEVARAQGHDARALAQGLESLVLFRDLDDQRGLSLALHNLGLVAAVQEQRRRAVRLCAAAAALREARGMRLAPVDQATADRVMGAMRAALGDHRFAAEWAAGRAQALDVTIAEAMGGDGATR